MPLRKVFAGEERSVTRSGNRYRIAIVTIILLSVVLGILLQANQTLSEPQGSQIQENARQPSTSSRTEQSPKSDSGLSLPPHLIQSVSGQDIYEGMLAFNLFYCPVLEEEDARLACENVRNSVVRVEMGSVYGSGVIFRMTADGVIIATNRHVLDYWQEDVGVIRFPQGFYVSAQALGSAKDCDVGFLMVDGSELGVETLLTLSCVPVDEAVCQTLSRGTNAFCLGADREAGELVFQEAVVEETDRYIDTFDGEMLYLRGFAKEGMSGGGIFDGHGYFIGLLAGGTWQDEVAGVPAKQVAQAYREIVGE